MCFTFFTASNKRIHIGDNSLLGWNVKIRDVDGHDIYNINIKNQEPINQNNRSTLEIMFGKAHIHILKGPYINGSNIVTYYSLLTEQNFADNNVAINVNPPRALKREAVWKS